MSRSVFPFYSGDISALARSLRGQLTASGHPPGHLELLNMLARATGCRNFQSLRAQWLAKEQIAQPQAQEPVDYVRVKRLTRHFDGQGRLVRWPAKQNQQELCVWALWSRLPARQCLTESQMNQILQSLHSFGDPALLRRQLFDYALVTRTPDGREYRRVERMPPPDAVALIRHLRERHAS